MKKNKHRLLTAETLIKGVLKGRHITPHSIDERLIDDTVQAIRAQNITLSQGAPEFISLKNLLQAPGIFIKPDHKNLLNSVCLYVLPFDVCMAFSDVDASGEAYIVISRGMIDLIASSIMLAQFQSLLPEALDDFYFYRFRKDMSGNALITNALYLMQVHFYRYGRALPNIAAVLSEEVLAQSAVAINGALTFILLHELGHHALGHISGEKRSVLPDVAMVIPEEMSDYQKEELQADYFALEAIHDQAKVIGTYWQQQAVTFFSQLEIISGLKLDQEHPMAINRSYFADGFREDWGQEHDVQPRKSYYEGLSKRFHDTKNSKNSEINALIETPYESCLGILKAANDVYSEYGLDFSPIWQSKPKSWLEIGSAYSEKL